MKKQKIKSKNNEKKEEIKDLDKLLETKVTEEKELELLRQKIEQDKARKRTRGPYRKSHVNWK